jgi:hypothetical protein
MPLRGREVRTIMGQKRKRPLSYRQRPFVGAPGFEPGASCSQSRHANRTALCPEENKETSEGEISCFLKWRRRRDSNPRYPVRVRRFSKPVVSATHPRLRVFLVEFEPLLKFWGRSANRLVYLRCVALLGSATHPRLRVFLVEFEPLLKFWGRSANRLVYLRCVALLGSATHPRLRVFLVEFEPLLKFWGRSANRLVYLRCVALLGSATHPRLRV